MRREKRNPNNTGVNMKNIIYIIGGILVIILITFITIFINYSKTINENTKLSKINTETLSDLSQNTIKSEETSNPIGKTVEESKKDEKTSDEKIAINTSTINKNSEVNNNEVKEKSNKVKQIQETKKEESKVVEKEPTFTKPVDGDIIKDFSKDNLIYSQTLNEWVTHLGIDIKAEKTAIVKSASDGKVKSIKNDPRYGLTIVIEHSKGYLTVYSNLLTSEFVVVGEEVKQGQTIGTVGNSAVFEIADESHLHFEILKDNIQIDPKLYLK